jgi:hypothetical protein
LGNLLFARLASPYPAADGVLIRFRYGRCWRPAFRFA